METIRTIERVCDVRRRLTLVSKNVYLNHRFGA
jgi:hypothetical protein